MNNVAILFVIDIALTYVPNCSIDKETLPTGLSKILTPDKRQGFAWTYDDLIHWCVYVSYEDSTD